MFATDETIALGITTALDYHTFIFPVTCSVWLMPMHAGVCSLVGGLDPPTVILLHPETVGFDRRGELLRQRFEVFSRFPAFL